MMQQRMAQRLEHRNEIGHPCRAWLVEQESKSESRVECSPLVAHFPYTMKCDQQVPCTTCLRREHGASCKYSKGGLDGPDKRDQESKTAEAQLRLQKLEKMVTSLMQTTKGTSNGHGGKIPRDALVDERTEEISTAGS